MEKQMEHTPTPWRMVPSIKVPRETIQASAGQQIAVIGETTIEQGTPEGNRDFLLRACNNHDYLVGAVKLLVEAIDDENEHDHDGEECDVCYAVDDARWRLERLDKQGETGANDLLLEAVELIEIAQANTIVVLEALQEALTPAEITVLQSYTVDFQKWLDKAKGKSDGNSTR